jgi:chemotaxis protein methyltransferase CheR
VAPSPGIAAGDVPRLVSVEDHELFAGIIRERAGIKLGANKRQLLSSRLRKRMRVLGMHSYEQYRRYLLDNMDREIVEFINVLTTNLTSFFRENHHFQYLRRYLDAAVPGRPLKFWSAGCATGEEPYSLSMVYHESTAMQRGVRLEILATDIDTQCLAVAEAGIYTREVTQGLEQERLAAHFLRGTGANEGRIRVRDHVRDPITFRPLNLLDPWEFNGPFDAIVCRNVVIYFDDQVQRNLFDRFADMLAPAGLLIIGHSENLQRVSDRYRSLGQTIYQRVY